MTTVIYGCMSCDSHVIFENKSLRMLVAMITLPFWIKEKGWLKTGEKIGFQLPRVQLKLLQSGKIFLRVSLTHG